MDSAGAPRRGATRRGARRSPRVVCLYLRRRRRRRQRRRRRRRRLASENPILLHRLQGPRGHAARKE